MQRSAAGPAPAPAVPPVVRDVLRSSGRPLDTKTRAFMEPRFGHDFSGVRVHSDDKAAASARAVNAHAYTAGEDVVFARGRYAPGTTEGRRLLAHELAHVVQQERGALRGRLAASGVAVSRPGDPLEREADEVAARVLSRPEPSAETPAAALSAAGADGGLQREATEEPAQSQDSGPAAPVTWSQSPAFGEPLELAPDEAAQRVNAALDVIGPGLTYVRRPPAAPEAVASAGDPIAVPDSPTLQTFPDLSLQREAGGASPLSKVHGGVVGSVQICWDCLTGEASLMGWIWAGVGYDAPLIGWVGGYYFGEQTWWKGQLGKWFEPGQCAPECDRNKDADATSGWGIAGFPIEVKPKQRAQFSKAGLEVGALLTPHSFCEADLEFIALLNILSYLGPVATVATKAVAGVNALTKDSPHVSLEAGIDASATFHLCRGANSLLAVNRADFCGGGFVGGGIGLSHSKEENHGAG